MDSLAGFFMLAQSTVEIEKIMPTMETVYVKVHTCTVCLSRTLTRGSDPCSSWDIYRIQT